MVKKAGLGDFEVQVSLQNTISSHNERLQRATMQAKQKGRAAVEALQNEELVGQAHLSLLVQGNNKALQVVF